MVDLSKMSRKEKIEYIWEYYKIHIIAATVAICVLVSFIHGQMTKVDYVFDMTVVSSISETQKSQLEKQLTDYVVTGGEKRKQALVDVMPLSNPQSNTKSTDVAMDSQYRQKLLVNIAAGSIDIIVLDKDLCTSFAKQGMFLSLTNLKGLDISSVKGNKIEMIGEDSNKSVYAMDAENIKLLKDAGIDTHNKVISIIASSKQKEKAADVLKWLLNGK